MIQHLHARILVLVSDCKCELVGLEKYFLADSLVTEPRDEAIGIEFDTRRSIGTASNLCSLLVDKLQAVFSDEVITANFGLLSNSDLHR